VDVADDAYQYWTNFGAGGVVSRPIGGGTTTPLATGENFPTTVAVNGTCVVWAHFERKSSVKR